MRTEPDSDPRPSAVFEDAEFKGGKGVCGVPCVRARIQRRGEGGESLSAEPHAFEPEFKGGRGGESCLRSPHAFEAAFREQEGECSFGAEDTGDLI